jgi:hypothetical protein
MSDLHDLAAVSIPDIRACNGDPVGRCHLGTRRRELARSG